MRSRTMTTMGTLSFRQSVFNQVGSTAKNWAVLVGLISSMALSSSLLAIDSQKIALGGLAVSPDNQTVAVAGVNRTLYLLNPETLEVRQRVALGFPVNELSYSSDGKCLLAYSASGKLTFLNTADWKPITTISNVESHCIAHEAQQVAVLLRPQRNKDQYVTEIKVLDLASGEEIKQAVLPVEAKELGTNPQASKFIVLTDYEKDDSEQPAEMPNDLADAAAKDNFKQQHDGKTSEVLWLDEALAIKSRTKTYYSLSFNNMLFVDGEVGRNIAYNNVNAEFASDGSTKNFRTPISFHYGMTMSADHKTLVAGSLREGVIYNIATNDARQFQIARDGNDGSEYLYGQTMGPDGSVYCGTSTFRVVKVSPQGKVVSVKPVF